MINLILKITTTLFLLISASGFSQVGHKNNNRTGSINFKCTMCAQKGRITIWGLDNYKKTIYTKKEEGDYIMRKTIYLPEGKYTYQYTDTNNNLSKGKFKITYKKQEVITFFE